MDLAFKPDEEAFREEVRDFLSDNLTEDLRRYAARMTSVYAEKEVGLAGQAPRRCHRWGSACADRP